MSERGTKKFSLYYVDAFTDIPFQGNPCTVVLDATTLTDLDRQRLALEFGLSETAFVEKVEGTWVKARFFTPAQELPFAGHPSLATVHALFESGALAETTRKVTLSLPAGEYTVHVKGRSSSRRYCLEQPKPHFLKTYDRSLIGEIFALAAEDLMVDVPVQTVSTGTPQLMVPVVNQRAVHRAVLDVPKLARLRSEGDFYSVHLFCIEDRSSDEQITYARHFCLPPDRTEDPFTGSATGGMAAYLWRFGLLREPRFLAYQGEPLNRPGEAEVELQVEGEDQEIKIIRVTGSAVTSLKGKFSFS